MPPIKSDKNIALATAIYEMSQSHEIDATNIEVNQGLKVTMNFGIMNRMCQILLEQQIRLIY